MSRGKCPGGKENEMKIKLMYKHAELIRRGKYGTARLLLRFLQRRRITLYLSAAEWELEHIFEQLNVCCTFCSRRGGSAEYKY
jgi:hypothetical protein